MTPDQSAAARMRSQRLTGPPPADLGDLVALQAQDVAATRLAAHNRRLSTVDCVRTWAMRGTLHLLHERDVGWIVALLGPVFIAAGKRRRDQLGLDEALCARALPALREVLAEPTDRAEVVRRLAETGVVLDPKSQAPAHLLAFAAHSGVLCRGMDDTYRLLDAEVADHGLPELWRRYLRAYGPAGVEDFAAWSGLPLRRIRSEITTEAIADVPPVAPTGAVRLLGHFDTYLLGYRDRSALLPPEFAPLVQTGGGFLTPHVVVDGRVVATWRREGDDVRIRPFAELDAAVVESVEAEVADLGVFLGVDAVPIWC